MQQQAFSTFPAFEQHASSQGETWEIPTKHRFTPATAKGDKKAGKGQVDLGQADLGEGRQPRVLNGTTLHAAPSGVGGAQ